MFEEGEGGSIANCGEAGLTRCRTLGRITVVLDLLPDDPPTTTTSFPTSLSFEFGMT